MNHSFVGEPKVISFEHLLQQVVLIFARGRGDLCLGEELGAPTYPCGFTAPLCRQLPCGIFGFLCSSLERIGFLSPFGSVLPLSGVPYSRTMTSADSCGFSATSRLRLRSDFAFFFLPQASPDKNVIFPPATTGVYRNSSWRLGISLCSGSSSGYPCLKSSSCTLARAFASGFLRILPRGRHPCPWLTVGARQPPFGTFTLEMTPMLGVPTSAPRPNAAGRFFSRDDRRNGPYAGGAAEVYFANRVPNLLIWLYKRNMRLQSTG